MASRACALRRAAVAARRTTEAPAARRAVVLGARQAFPAAAVRRSLSGSAFSLEPPEETLWPNQKPAEGESYELNWSICGSGVVPLGKAFRNLRLPELAAAGGSLLDTSAPGDAVYATVEKGVKESLGSASNTLYVQDCALGTMLANEVPIRIITDNAAAAAAFKTFCAAARTVPLPKYEEDVTVLLSSVASSPYIASSKAQKTVLMGGSFNTEALAKHVAAIASDSFLDRGVLPMFGSGAHNVVYLGAGFESGAIVKYGFSFSSAGFCRLYAEGGGLPNSLPMPKAVVMFANDATGAIPAASVLDAAQAGFYYVGACAPTGMTNMEVAASLMMQLGTTSKVYMINKASYGSEAEAREAAKAVVGQTGSKGALGLQVITAGSADQGAIDAMAKSLTTAVAGKVKKSEAIIKAGPPLPPPLAK